MLDLSISIVSWNARDLLEDCLRSIFEPALPAGRQNHRIGFEVIVVDNGSKDRSPDFVREKFPRVKLISLDHNAGFPKANNLAIKESTGRYLLLLNQDTYLKPAALDKMVEFMDQHPQVGALGPRIEFPNGKIQPSCLGFPTLGAMLLRNLMLERLLPRNPISKKYILPDFNHTQTQEVDQPMGAALLVRRATIDQVGMMDENIHFFFDEVDWCYRIKKAGFKIYFFADATVVHHGGASFKKWNPLKLGKTWNQSRDYYFGKHFGKREVSILKISDALKLIIILCILVGIISLVIKIVNLFFVP
jgi:GT2 family glycosyltransferase